MTNLLCALMISVATAQGENLQILDHASTPNRMMTLYLNNLANVALDKRDEDRDALRTSEEITASGVELRRFFLDELGPFPDKNDLNARVVDKQERDGYRFEKVIFESRPGMFVTGVLFLPLCDAPYPGVLVPCGHSATGKLNEVYQRACISLAQNGIAAFIYDPIGQGERYQLLDENDKPRFGATIEHMIVGVGCIPLGMNTASYRIWDGIRALDYLTSRPEIDPKRIGCTGNSGGGTMTSYLMALDDRIACAAPGCYLTSFRRLLEKAGPQDAEQSIFGQIAKGMDHPDYILMRAPKPTLMLTATHDFFDIRGAWESFREAKRAYTKMGFPERVDLVEANEEHGFSLPLRTGMVRWMRRWLSGIDEPVSEREFPILSEEEMRCSPEGQVLLMDDAKSVFSYNIEYMKTLERERKELRKSFTSEAFRERIRGIAGIRSLKDLPQPDVKKTGRIERKDYYIEKIIVSPEPGISLPGLVFIPATPDDNAYLYMNDKGKDVDAAPGGRIEELVLKNHIVFAVDLRGIGETECVSEDKKYDELFGHGWDAFYRAYLLGKSCIGMRAEDVLTAARYMACLQDGKKRGVHAIATGNAGLPALHAAALEPDLFASLHVENALRSWTELVKKPIAKQQLMNTIHGALRVYDLPDLVSLVSCREVVVEKPLEFSQEDEAR